MSYALGIQTFAERETRIAAATEGQLAAARAIYATGRSAFDAEDYPTALTAFTEAWAIVPNPAALLAIGTAMQRLGRFQDALYRYQRYIREYPDGPQLALAHDGAATAQVMLEQAAAAVSHGAAAVPVPPEVSPEVLAAKRAAPPTPQEAMRSAPPVQRSYDSTPPYGLWAATGIGVVAVIGLGAYFIFKTKRPRPAPKKNRRRTSRRRR
jgi:tetratricopeptide (TPR) repeat protein